MKSGNTAIANIPEIKTISPSSTPRDRAINTTSEDRASSSSNTSSSSSPSDLRRRLQDLSSPNEFNLLADRVAALGRRICRKRELFLRLQGVASRIEENDEWEEKEQRAESESSLASSRPKDARARRRARIRLESSPCRDDGTMVISQAGDPTGPSKITGHADESNRAAEFPADRSARDGDRLRLPAIGMQPQKQPRSSSLSELSSARFPHRNNHGKPRGIKTNAACHSHRRNLTSRDSASRSADPPSVSSFSLSSARPRKFGGYRPSPGVVMKNLSSGSESESANEASRRFARKVDNSIATLESSSPESKAAVVNGSVRKAPVMSARNNIANSVLPNLLPSTRSLDSDDRRTLRDTPGSCIAERMNRDGSVMRISNESKTSTVRDPSETIIRKEQVSRDGLATKTSGKFQQNEDTRDRREEMPQNTSAFSARNFASNSADFAPSIRNEPQGGPAMRDYKHYAERKQKYKRDEKEEAESYRFIAPEIHRADIKGQFDLICALTERCNLEGSYLENTDEEILDTAKWRLFANLCPEKSANASHLTERVKNDAAEEALSSQTSEQIESEDHSRSSCAKVYVQREMLSSRRSKNDTDASDKCDREMALATNVPTLALNSQDISYSTSADSRECSATRPLDPHALIKALSDVSLRRERQGQGVSRKREDFYRRDKDTIDAASNFPTIGETWRAPRSSESPRQPLSRAPSRIPIRISSSRIMSPAMAEELSCCQANSENSEIANYEEAKCRDPDVPRSENITHRPEVDWRSENIEDAILQARSRIFAPGDKAADHEPEAASNLRSSQSAPFDDHACNLARQPLPESGRSCPTFFNKTAHSAGREDYYVKIDDDVRSRSNYSTSQKSAETLDITSATESPCLSKRKRDFVRRETFFRDAEENVTWRTEDECPSINDEENPEDVKDETHYGPDELYSQTTQERFGLASGETHNLSSSKIQLDLLSEVKRIVTKQRASDDSEFNVDESSFDCNLESEKIAESENLISQVYSTREISSFGARMSSSTLNLSRESKRRRKSQERFPFTISEASGALSTEYKDTSDCQLPDKCDFRRTGVDEQLEESAAHRLKMHPSITRLAASGLDDTVADILCCVAQQEDEAPTKSRLKAFMRILSSKLKKKPKKRSNGDKTVEPAKIIYENRACQVDSRANSCSGDSSVEEARINLKSASDCWTGHVTRSNPTFASSGYTLRKTGSFEAIVQEHPRRRYDRDDLWVQDVKNPSIDEERGSKTLREKNKMDNLEESPSKDRYSIFLAKNFQVADNLSASNIDRSDSKRQHDVLSDHVTPSDGKNEENIDRKLSSGLRRFSISEVEGIEEDLTSCFCWKLCRIIGRPGIDR